MMSSEVNYCKYQYQLSGRFSGSCIVSKCCYVQLKKERCVSSLTFPASQLGIIVVYFTYLASVNNSDPHVKVYSFDCENI